MTNTSKIARLPHAIREQLNHRLLDAEPAEPLLSWLNALPEVQAILKQQFAGHPISPQNLSEWRNGAFAEWSLRQEIFGAFQSADETATAIDEISNHCLVDKLLTLLTAHYARFMNRWDGEVTPAINQQLKALSRLTRDLTTLQKAAQRTKQLVRHLVRHSSSDDGSLGDGGSFSEGGSDLIKPNQGISGVGTARPHKSPSSPEPTPDARPQIPDPSATPTSALSPQPSDLSTDQIKPNQGIPPKSPADLRLETLDVSPQDLLADPGICRRLLEKYGFAPAASFEISPETLNFCPSSVLSIALNQTKSTSAILKNPLNQLTAA